MYANSVATPISIITANYDKFYNFVKGLYYRIWLDSNKPPNN